MDIGPINGRRTKFASRGPAEAAGFRRESLRYLKVAGGLLLTALLLSQPRATALGAAGAMARWYVSVAPALFPFLALMPLLTCPDAAEVYEKLLGRAMRVLFNLPGAAASAMVVGMAAGSPAGAIAARNVAARSGMSRGELQRTAVAAAGFSPAFLVSGVGAGLLGSAAMGWKLLAAQILTQLTMAVLLRGAWKGRTEPAPPVARSAAEQPVRGAVLGVLTICGYMALFGAIAGAVRAYLGDTVAKALLCLLDVPSGTATVAESNMEMSLKITLLAALCGFGGICVAAQNLNVLKDCDMRVIEYVGLRTMAAALCGGYMALLLRMPRVDVGIFSKVARENPLTIAAMSAALLALPGAVRLGKSILNNS